MKTTIFLLMGLLLFIPSQSFAKDFSRLQVKFSTDINKDCSLSSGYDPVWGCYIQELLPGDAFPKPKIFIRSDLPSTLLPYVFLHEFGHFLIYDESEEELKKFFDEVKKFNEEQGREVVRVYPPNGGYKINAPLKK